MPPAKSRAPSSAATTGRLLIVGTPIGNLRDLSPRVTDALATADLIAAEDTRTTRALLSHLSLSTRLTSYFEGNEAAKTGELLRAMTSGQVVALVSEAGMPLVSDPGYRLVRACLEAGLPIEIIPGPSAVLAALVGSGLPTDEFHFVGFLPRKGKTRRDRLHAWRDNPTTLVIFESNHRLAATLRELADALGDREAAVARELTRKHEEFVRGRLARLAERFEQQPARGQVTVVVAGAADRAAAGETVESSEAAAVLKAAVSDALGRGLSPRDIYQLAIEIRERRAD